jgi:hypothetical protein
MARGALLCLFLPRHKETPIWPASSAKIDLWCAWAALVSGCSSHKIGEMSRATGPGHSQQVMLSVAKILVSRGLAVAVLTEFMAESMTEIRGLRRNVCAADHSPLRWLARVCGQCSGRTHLACSTASRMPAGGASPSVLCTTRVTLVVAGSELKTRPTIMS